MQDEEIKHEKDNYEKDDEPYTQESPEIRDLLMLIHILFVNKVHTIPLGSYIHF